MLRQTGGPGSLVEAVPAKPDPPSKRFDPHYVAVVLDPETAADEDEELAGLVASELRKVKPVNPGRAQTFGALDRPRSELRRVGWNLAVRRVWAVPGGWRALVLVSPQVRGGDGRLVGIANVHREEWTFVGGQLELAAEEADRSAAAGFTGMARRLRAGCPRQAARIAISRHDAGVRAGAEGPAPGAAAGSAASSDVPWIAVLRI